MAPMLPAPGRHQLIAAVADVYPVAVAVTVSFPPPFPTPELLYVNVLELWELPFGIVRATPVL
jgi:hypothetical protein